MGVGSGTRGPKTETTVLTVLSGYLGQSQGPRGNLSGVSNVLEPLRRVTIAITQKHASMKLVLARYCNSIIQ